MHIVPVTDHVQVALDGDENFEGNPEEITKNGEAASSNGHEITV